MCFKHESPRVLEHMPTHPHEKHTKAHMYLCKIFPGTVRSCGVKSYTRSLCLCTSWFCTLFSRSPSTASLSHRVPFRLPPCSRRFSPLFLTPIFLFSSPFFSYSSTRPPTLYCQFQKLVLTQCCAGAVFGRFLGFFF